MKQIVAAIIGDNHFGCKNFNKNILNLQLEFFEKQFFPYILKNNIKYVLHVGDIFHNRNLIDIFILQNIKKRFFQWFDDNDVQLITCLGNHDIYYKNTLEYNLPENSTTEYKKVKVITTPEILKIGPYKTAFYPWLVEDENFEMEESVDLTVGHFDIHGFQMVKNIFSQDGIQQSKLDKSKLVFSGHFHIKSELRNIKYIGTQYQITWNDYGDEKGFFIIDDNFKTKFIENKISPKFVKIYYRQENDEELFDVGGLSKEIETKISKEVINIAKHNYVKLITGKIVNQTKFDLFYKAINDVSKDNYKIEIIDNNEVIENFNFEEIEKSIEENSNIFDIVKAYMNNATYTEDDINKEKLENIFKELYKEAEDFITDSRATSE